MNKRFAETALKIGSWLEKNNYKGIDAASRDMAIECSTTFSFSAGAWLNLYRKTKNELYLQKAISCANRIINLQDENGSWPFPVKFRNNPANQYYACETLFSALILPDLYIKTKDKRYLDSAMRAKKFLFNQNGLQRLNEDEYCLWYSSTDKIHIPNLGSFAGNFFSKLYQITGEDEDLKLARAFANFCIRSLETNGRMPYYKPPHNKELLDLQSYAYDLSSHRVSSIEQLSDVYSTSYHALSTFEIDSVYGRIKEDYFRDFVLKSIKFLSTLQGRNGSLPEKERKMSSLWFLRNIKVCYTSAKTLAWSAKAFLAASKYSSKYYKSALKAANYLIDRCMDEDGGCRYFIYLDGSTKENEKFIRGAAIAFEAITNFV